MKNIHLVLAEESYLSLNCSYRDSAIGTEVGKPYWIYSKDWKHHLSVTDASVRPQNIYITNSEEIKEGDWYITILDNEIYKADSDTEIIMSVANKCDNTTYKNTHFKIILSTDQDLIKDGVQAIDDEFLEWFVKNPSCEEVETIYGLFNPMGRQVDPMNLGQNHSQCIWKYKIIISKQKTKDRIMSETSKETKQKAKDYGNSLVTETKTLQDIAENYATDKQNEKASKFYIALESFIAGYKLAQETKKKTI